MFKFYTPWKHKKSGCFVIFSEGIEWNLDLKWVNLQQSNIIEEI